LEEEIDRSKEIIVCWQWDL